jgi:hypothetical protein
MATISVPKPRLEALEKKEQAHDDYLAGLRALKARSASIELEVRGIREPDLTARFNSLEGRTYFAEGYRQALEDISHAIVAASQARHEDELVRAALPG